MQQIDYQPMDSPQWCLCCHQPLALSARQCPVCSWPIGEPVQLDNRLLCNGRFRLLRRMGYGGTACLYLAEVPQTGELRVVKEFQPPAEWKARALFETMFVDEVRLLSRLSHEPILVSRYYDSFIDSGAFYIVLEFVPGQDLALYLNAHPGGLPFGEVIDYIQQVAGILEVIHRLEPAPVVHGDIKPSNLIRRPDGRIVLIDFGVAQTNEPMPSYVPVRASAFGTPGYTPPEQWEGHPTPASDIFALGATMHQLLSGYDPTARFARLGQVSFTDLKVLTTFPPLTSLVPDAPALLETLLTQMLQRRAASRPTAAEVQARLAQISALFTH